MRVRRVTQTTRVYTAHRCSVPATGRRRFPFPVITGLCRRVWVHYWCARGFRVPIVIIILFSSFPYTLCNIIRFCFILYYAVRRAVLECFGVGWRGGTEYHFSVWLYYVSRYDQLNSTLKSSTILLYLPFCTLLQFFFNFIYKHSIYWRLNRYFCCSSVISRITTFF